MENEKEDKQEQERDKKLEQLHGALKWALFLISFRALIMANIALLLPLEDGSLWFECILDGALNILLLITISRLPNHKAKGFWQFVGMMGTIIQYNLIGAAFATDEYSISGEGGFSFHSEGYLTDALITFLILAAVLLLMLLKKNGRNAYDVILKEEQPDGE